MGRCGWVRDSFMGKRHHGAVLQAFVRSKVIECELFRCCVRDFASYAWRPC
jgi:hypothetical protein